MNIQLNKKNLGIQGLRGLLMIWIVLFHFTTRYGQLYPNKINYTIEFSNGGTVGVVMFFIISGFFFAKLFATYTPPLKVNLCLKEVSQIFLKRYFKLWKPYFISCLLIIVILHFIPLYGRTNNSFFNIVINLFFIWHPKIDYIDSAHWFMSDLIYIQFVLLVFLFIKKYRYRVFSCFLGGLILGYILYSLYPNNLLLKLNAMLHFRNMLAFCLGIYFYLNIQKKVNVFMGNLLQMSGIVSLVVCMSAIWLLVYYFIFLSLIAENKYLYYIFSRKIIVFIGEISFYWYLIHQNVGYSLLNILSENISHSELLLWVPFFASLILAIAIHKIIRILPVSFSKKF